MTCPSRPFAFLPHPFKIDGGVSSGVLTAKPIAASTQVKKPPKTKEQLKEWSSEQTPNQTIEMEEGFWVSITGLLALGAFPEVPFA